MYWRRLLLNGIGCGSSIMRAKTPLYLVRPTNASDSLLGLGANSLVGRKAHEDGKRNCINIIYYNNY